MKIKSVVLRPVGFLLAALAFALIFYGMGLLVRPDMSSEAPAQYTTEQLQAARAARDTSMDPDNPLRIQRDVDYSKGPKAAWYPKGESPILADLVAEGKLAPVAERVGPEPVVLDGLDGIGQYGGIWVRIGGSDSDVYGPVAARMGYPTLVRWSPQGYPIVPHIAKSWEISDDYREYVFHLRKGIRWSDGHPFTADDIMYWWENEANDKAIYPQPPGMMMVQGQLGSLEKIDDYTIRITFPKPKGQFLESLASSGGILLCNSPKHYLQQYHHSLGNRELIDATKARKGLEEDISVYFQLKVTQNTEHPRMWPWVYRTYKSNPPFTFVRNPYYFAVDKEGNQLPYVDEIYYEVKDGEMLAISIANGQATCQARGLGFGRYTLMMNGREESGYEVIHWSHGSGSPITISPNLNLRVDPEKPATKWKSQLLNDKRFRQALSLAINRQAIIDAEFNGQTVPCQVAPGPESYFYHPKAFKAFTEYDPQRAGELLDEIGLTQRDREGYRTFPDGTRMQFFLSYSNNTPPGSVQFIIDDWAAVGVRMLDHYRNRALYDTERVGMMHDFSIWGSDGMISPVLNIAQYVPIQEMSNFALGYGRWYSRGGMYGSPEAETSACIEPPKDHPLRRAMEIHEKVVATGDRAEQRELMNEILDIAAENVWTISICNSPPTIVAKKNGFHGVPDTAVSSWTTLDPGNAGVETWYFDEPKASPGAIQQMKDSILATTPPTDSIAGAKADAANVGKQVWSWIRTALVLILLAGLLTTAIRYPYIGRRLLIMIPTLAIISVIVFTVIQLPPGDYVNSRITYFRERGDVADLQQLEELRRLFHLEEPFWKQYCRWMGFYWFVPKQVQVEVKPEESEDAAETVEIAQTAPATTEPATMQATTQVAAADESPPGGEPEKQYEMKWTIFRPEDKGLLQGDLGRSMESNKPVNDMVGDRIKLTVLISLATVLFTWTLAVPTGIYSAVRQYSLGDYVFTLFGFLGMCIPQFLLAILLIFFSKKWFGLEVSGLFSAEYGSQPEWTAGKVLDLLKHLWVPVLILGVGGTAGMIRVMRANLLDELKKPYVTTARAKGVRPGKLILKYPVRLALNPFISGIGGIFPMLISGGAIVAIVLTLPTVGPLLLSSLQNEDFYLSGSMLMVLSLLGIFGTLVSDLLLLWLDPRIRFQGGQR